MKGKPVAQRWPSMTDAEFLESRSVPEPNTGCILWFGRTHGRGTQAYGRARGQFAHRLAWKLAHGKSAGRRCVLHKCDTPACINTTHMFLGTRSDNMRDMWRKGRGATGTMAERKRRKRQ